MSSVSKKLLASALKLPRKSRAMLAERLLESLESQTAVDAAIEECERRWQAFKEGKIKGLTLEEVFPDLVRRKSRTNS